MHRHWLDCRDEESESRRRWHTSGSPPQWAAHLSVLLSTWPALPSETGSPSSNGLSAEIHSQKSRDICADAHTHTNNVKHIWALHYMQRQRLFCLLPTGETILLKVVLRLIFRCLLRTSLSDSRQLEAPTQEAKHTLSLVSNNCLGLVIIYVYIYIHIYIHTHIFI